MPDDQTGERPVGIDEKTYRSFLVRCWQERGAGNGAPAWRFTLVQVGEEKRQRGFASLDDIVAYLREELEAV